MVSGSFSADAQTRWSLAAGGGYRFSRRLSFGTELTWSRLRNVDAAYGPPFYPSSLGPSTRTLVSFTTNGRVDLPRVRRVVPFLLAGGGVATDSVRRDVVSGQVQSVTPRAEAQTFLAMLVGAGVDVVAGRRVSVGVDWKLLHMQGHVGEWWRVGVGASYRF